MAPQELMIGDIIRYTDYDGNIFYCKVVGLDNDEVIYLQDILDVDINLYNSKAFVRIEPIEITEDFLLKNNFALCENCTSRWKKRTGSKVIYVTKPEGPGYVDVTQDVHNGFKTIIREFELSYIHELQHVFKICKAEINWEF